MNRVVVLDGRPPRYCFNPACGMTLQPPTYGMHDLCTRCKRDGYVLRYYPGARVLQRRCAICRYEYDANKRCPEGHVTNALPLSEEDDWYYS